MFGGLDRRQGRGDIRYEIFFSITAMNALIRNHLGENDLSSSIARLILKVILRILAEAAGRLET